MGYNKIQRRITAYVYGKRRFNRSCVRLYKSCDEVKNVLNCEKIPGKMTQKLSR